MPLLEWVADLPSGMRDGGLVLREHDLSNGQVRATLCRLVATLAKLMRASARWASFVVVPCLNERESLEATCRSLGFAASVEPPDGCGLILVDNGSTDGSVQLCEWIRDASPGSVVVAQESERGYVPARRHGIDIAAEITQDADIPADRVIIIQADADTGYSAGYAVAMRDALSRAGPGHLAQAITTRPAEFAHQHPLVLELENADQLDGLDDRDRDFDIIVDDKACAFTLSDYRRWGGHRREYLPDGEELLAETTRLFIAARLNGATRVDVDGAMVSHSLRRIEADAVQELAAAGFPYSRRRMLGGEPLTLDALEDRVASGDRTILEQIRAVRHAHLVGLFEMLPAHLARSVGVMRTDSRALRALDALPPRHHDEAVTRPGQLLADVLDLIAQGPDGPMSSVLA